MRHVNIQRQLPDKKPQWRFNKRTGKLIRKAKAGGIDWYRYGRAILTKKLILFANKYTKLSKQLLIKNCEICKK